MILSGFQEEHQLLDWYEQDSISALQYISFNRYDQPLQEVVSGEWKQ